MSIALLTKSRQTLAVNGGTTSSIDTSGASLITISVGFYAGNTDCTHITDSKGNTWAQTARKNTGSGQNNSVTIFYSVNPTVGTGHTFTFNESGSLYYPEVLIRAWSGVQTSPTPFDQVNGASGNATSSLATGSVTPGSNNELLLAAVVGSGASISEVVSGGFTDFTFESGDTVQLAGDAYLIQTTAAAANPSFSGTSIGRAAAIVTFKAAAAVNAFLAKPSRSLYLDEDDSYADCPDSICVA